MIALKTKVKIIISTKIFKNLIQNFQKSFNKIINYDYTISHFIVK